MEFYEYFDKRYLNPINKFVSDFENWNDVEIDESNESMISLNDLSERIIVDPIYFNQGLLGTNKDCFIRKSVALKLLRILDIIPEKFNILIWDGYRSIETQKELFNKYKNIFKTELKIDGEELENYTKKFVSYPSYDKKSPAPHTTGAAIDLTICDKNGDKINIGCDFDEFCDIANTRYFEEKIENGESLSDQEKIILFNRRVLCNIFDEVGFANYPYEIWHKSYKDQMYIKLKNENNKALYGEVKI